MAQAIFKSWFVDFEPWGGVMPEDWRTTTLGEPLFTQTFHNYVESRRLAKLRDTLLLRLMSGELSIDSD
jgi:type I restriction enzyme S subunit